MRFSRALIEDAIAGACKRVELPGFDARRGIEVGGGHVHIGTGGAAVQVLESDGRVFRDSTLGDLFGLMRVVDACDTNHYSLRPVVARDMGDPLTLDINTAFAAMKATSKPIGTSFFEPANVAPVVEMLDAAIGDKPFASHFRPAHRFHDRWLGGGGGGECHRSTAFAGAWPALHCCGGRFGVR